MPGVGASGGGHATCLRSGEREYLSVRAAVRRQRQGGLVLGVDGIHASGRRRVACPVSRSTGGTCVTAAARVVMCAPSPPAPPSSSALRLRCTAVAPRRPTVRPRTHFAWTLQRPQSPKQRPHRPLKAMPSCSPLPFMRANLSQLLPWPAWSVTAPLRALLRISAMVHRCRRC